MDFRYPDGEEYVLKDFCLKVPQGTNVAIVGETGAGKSTLVNLVCRFYEPTRGRVLIDGRRFCGCTAASDTYCRHRIFSPEQSVTISGTGIRTRTMMRSGRH